MTTTTRPSTKLGDASGHAIRAAAYALDYVLPLTVIAAYRLIPAGQRGTLFGGPSASRAAMTALLSAKAGGWAILRGAASNHPPRPHLP